MLESIRVFLSMENFMYFSMVLIVTLKIFVFCIEAKDKNAMYKMREKYITPTKTIKEKE